MMIYELVCEQGHSFEGWFKDSASFERQLAKGMVQCPICGTIQVSQRLKTGGMLKSRDGGSQPSASLSEDPRAALRALRQIIETHFENVGPEFAKVALRMHYGVEEPRNIRGTTTEAEEKMLRDEGIQFIKIPLPPSEPEEPIH
jgi:hypothetical protein